MFENDDLGVSLRVGLSDASLPAGKGRSSCRFVLQRHSGLYASIPHAPAFAGRLRSLRFYISIFISYK